MFILRTRPAVYFNGPCPLWQQPRRAKREPGLYVALDLWLPGLVTHHAVRGEGHHLPERPETLLQGRPHGPESLSRELFGSGLKLAGNHGLLQPGGQDLASRRAQSASYVRDLVARIRTAEFLDGSLRAKAIGVGR